MTSWSKKPIIIDNKISVVFTWQLKEAIKIAKSISNCKIGGPAVRIYPEIVPRELSCLDDDGDWLSKHNPAATRTSIGCIRNCEFCLVNKIEPEFKELSNFEPKPNLCDNNFLATSKAHIIKSIDKLVSIKDIDFNQGLDARLFKPWHIDQFKRLKWHVIRFAWDHSNQEEYVIDTINSLLRSGFPKSKIRCYVLVGFKETFLEAQYRCETLKSLGIFANPMRYQPRNNLVKNEYVPHGWSQNLLNSFTKYWWKIRFLRKVSFTEFLESYHPPRKLPPILKENK